MEWATEVVGLAGGINSTFLNLLRINVWLVVVGYLLGSVALAQRSAIWKECPGTWSVTAGLGTTYYTGDLAVIGNYNHLALGAAWNLGLTYRYSNRLSLRAEAQGYYIRGSQVRTRNFVKNLSFFSVNPDLWAGIQWDVRNPNDPNRSFFPYLMAGAGLTYMTPKTTFHGQTVSLAPLHTEGVPYDRVAGIIRYGAGMPIMTGYRFKLALEASYTHVLSDYLDDVSTVYPTFETMSSLAAALSDRKGELGLWPNRPGDNRGNPGKKDGYFILSGRLIYTIDTPVHRWHRLRSRG